jgi:hypothetical protein
MTEPSDPFNKYEARAPSTFTLALQVTWNLEDSPERIKAEFEARRVGLILGWAILAIEDSGKRKELAREISREAMKAPSQEINLIPQVLERYGYEINEQLFEEDMYNYWTTIELVLKNTIFDRELRHALETHIPAGERGNCYLDSSAV